MVRNIKIHTILVVNAAQLAITDRVFTKMSSSLPRRRTVRLDASCCERRVVFFSSYNLSRVRLLISISVSDGMHKLLIEGKPILLREEDKDIDDSGLKFSED